MKFIILLCLIFSTYGHQYEIYELEVLDSDYCSYCVQDLDEELVLQSVCWDLGSTMEIKPTTHLFSVEHYARGYELFN